MSHIFLIGFMGAGKSTVGPLLAKRLGLEFIDLDDMIVNACNGASIARIFEDFGEAEFRRLERCALTVCTGHPPSVVACGGGIVTDSDSRAYMRELGTVVYLRTTVAETLERIPDRSSRPLLTGPDAEHDAQALLEARSALYEDAADIEVDTVGRTPEAIASEIAQLVESHVRETEAER
jgi:shikimate kinase